MMSPPLNRFVDDYVERALKIIESIAPESTMDPKRIHQTLSKQLLAGRQSPHHNEHWEVAIYALTAWTDEVMLETDWPGRDWWNDHVLEVNLFGTRLCSERFFELAKAAAHDPASGLLRVFHDCVLLGFRGVYSLTEFGDAVTTQLGIAPTVQQWLCETQERLMLNGTAPKALAVHRQLGGAAPRSDRRLVVWWSIAAGLLLAANVTVYTLVKIS